MRVLCNGDAIAAGIAVIHQELQYVPELTWILFLRILDAQEVRDQEKAEAVGATFTPALRTPYRWRDWAAPDSPMRQDTKVEDRRAHV